MAGYAEGALERLLSSLDQKANAGIVAAELRGLAAAQWEPHSGKGENWTAIYNMWLLLGESYRLDSFWRGTPAHAGWRGRRGYPFILFQYACFGIWCKLWECTALVESSRRWCLLELESLREPLGPSKSVVECLLADQLQAGSATEWAGIRRRYTRGGLDRTAVHNDMFPFDVLAPELAWCRREGHYVTGLSAITEFPEFQEWPVNDETERALVALAGSEWATV